jgi:hypothetical protein
MSQRATRAAVSEPTPAPGSMSRQPASVGSGAIDATRLAEACGVKNCPRSARAFGSRMALVLERRCSTLAKNPSTEDTPTVCQPDRPTLQISALKATNRISLAAATGFSMHLVGQLSNPSAALKAVFEARSDEPIKATVRLEPQLEVGRLGNGVVQRAVVKVLASAQRPLTVLEAQAAVVDLLGHPVSKGSVNCCLSTGALGDEPHLERVARGCYRLRHD